MAKLFLIFLSTIFFWTIVTTLPATNDKTEKVTQNEVSINFVTEKAANIEKERKVEPEVSVSVEGTVGVTKPTENDGKNTTRGPVSTTPHPKNQNVFSRFIDDIFQIPITVLQSVSKLLTNPFTQQAKEKDQSDSTVF